jgi:hypothetical protein
MRQKRVKNVVGPLEGGLISDRCCVGGDWGLRTFNPNTDLNPIIMKTSMTIVLFLFLGFIAGLTPGGAQFKAEMTDVRKEVGYQYLCLEGGGR